MSTAEYPDALTRRIAQLAAASVEDPDAEARAVATLVGALRSDIGAVRAELGSLRAETGAVRSDLDGVGGRLAEVRTALPGLSRELRDGLAEVPARLAALEDALDGMSERLEALGRDGASTTTARLAALEGGVGALAEQLRSDALESTELLVDRLRQDTATRLAEHEQSLLGRLSDVLGRRDDALLREVLGALGEARVQAAAEQAVVVERLTEVMRGTAVSKDAARDAADRLTALAALTGRTEDALSALAEQLAGLDAAVARGTLADERTAAVLGDVGTSTEALNETIAGFRAEWPTRTFEVVQGARAVAEGVVVEVRQEVSAQLVRVREELARAVAGVEDAGSGISSGTDRLAGVGSVLVAYLEQRDRLLEAERDRVLHEVLDTFAAGLSARDRTALSGRVTDAVARRRDARDADRYRAAVGAPVPPVVDLPAAVRALAPAPAADVTADRVAARALRAESPGPSPAATPSTAVRSGPPLPGRTRPAPAAAVARRPPTGAAGPAADRSDPMALERVAPGPAAPARAGGRQAGSGKAGGPSAGGPSAGGPSAGGPSAGGPSAGTPGLAAPGDAAGKGTGSERRARVEAMPEARSQALALEAAAPGPPPPTAQAPDAG